jgi:hypothetical protein
MKSDKRSEFLTRDSLLRLLSDDEVASVSMAEATGTLQDGDEYLDLRHLAKGVQRAIGTTTPTGPTLARKAVREATWYALLTHLPGARNSTEHGGTQGQHP